MQFVLSELKQSWKRDTNFMFLFLILAIIGIICIGIAIDINEQTEEQINTYKEVYEDYQYCSILDNFAATANILEDMSNMEKFETFLQLLNSSEYFQYFMVYNHPVYVEGYLGPDENIDGYESSSDLSSRTVEILDEKGTYHTCTALKGFWIGSNVVDYFGLQLSDGVDFGNEDYWFNPNETMPIILGANYKDIYNVGDELYIDFVFSDTKAKVIGILEENSSIYYRGKHQNLDRYIVMPIFVNVEFEGETLYNFETGALHFYTFRISGTIASKLELTHINEIIDSYSKEAGFETEDAYYVIEYNPESKENFDFAIESIGMLVTLILIFVISASVVALSIFIGNRINKSKRYYAILMLNGCKKSQICWILLAELFIVFSLSYCIAMVCLVNIVDLKFFFEGGQSILLGIWTFLYAVIPVVISIILFLKNDLIYYLKEKVEYVET